MRDPELRDDPDNEVDFASDLYDVGTWAASELSDRVRRHPYAVLGAAAGLGLLISGGGAARWAAAAMALALREAGRWAAREALRQLAEAPSRDPFSSARASTSTSGHRSTSST